MKARLPAFVVCRFRFLGSTGRLLKRCLAIGVGMLASLHLYAQGTVNFSNLGLNAPLFNGLTCANAVAGTTYSVALYWSPYDPTSPNAPDQPFTQQGPSGHLAIPGIYSVGTVTLPGITPPGGLGWFQVRAWSTAYDGVTFISFEDALASGQPVGESNVILIPTGNPLPPTPTVPHQLTGISPIVFGELIGFPPCVPEPSVLVLLFCGAGILLFSASRHRNN